MNRSRGEAAETVHHLFMAKLKGYLSESTFSDYRARYKECIRMLNGLERTLERKLPEQDRRWLVAEATAAYQAGDPLCPPGWPVPTET